MIQIKLWQWWSRHRVPIDGCYLCHVRMRARAMDGWDRYKRGDYPLKSKWIWWSTRRKLPFIMIKRHGFKEGWKRYRIMRTQIRMSDVKRGS